jgi:hypothetical protein
MNVREGAFRMQRVGRGIVFIATASAVLSIIIGIVTHFISGTNSVLLLGFAIPGFLYLSLFPALCGGLLWIAGWIVEGFAMPNNSSTSPIDAPASSAPAQQG